MHELATVVSVALEDDNVVHVVAGQVLEELVEKRVLLVAEGAEVVGSKGVGGDQVVFELVHRGGQEVTGTSAHVSRFEPNLSALHSTFVIWVSQMCQLFFCIAEFRSQNF